MGRTCCDEVPNQTVLPVVYHKMRHRRLSLSNTTEEQRASVINVQTQD
jgi:hypothetical protein